MNRNIIIAIIVVVVLAVAGYSLLRGKSNQAVAPTTQEQQTVSTVPTQATTETTPAATQSANAMTVQYTDQGFDPKTITINKGEKVTWINKSSSQMWVASNPHPVHTDYPGFDQLSGIEAGGTYSFTFQKTGNWGYHNHLNPSQGGTVVVK